MQNIPPPNETSTVRFYRTSPVKRIRRTAAQVDDLLTAITGIIDNEDDRITIRHLFYRLVGLRVIEKTDAAYKGLCQHLSKWRRSGAVRWDAFADNTRWHIGGRTFDSMADALNHTVDCYRRNLWAEQNAYVEIWTEKDAISGILAKEADSFGVKTFTCRGFASLTALYDAAQTFKAATENGKHVFIYYFGDHDPSGLDIDRAAVNSFINDFGVEVELVRAAITPEQIREYELPTRPVKKSDRRAAGWEGGCVEIDTLAPTVLRQLVHDAIVAHIDARQWNQTRQVEKMERETLRQISLKAA